VRSASGKRTRRLAKIAALTLEEPIEPKHVEPFLRRKAALQEEIETLQHELDALQAKRKETPHHITVDQLRGGALSPAQHPLQAPHRYHPDDRLSCRDRDGQQLARAPQTAARGPSPPACPLHHRRDLLPDPDAGTWTVRLQPGANAATDQVIAKLCEELNATETIFPRTKLRLVLKLGST
jgi:hypothetical protein